MPRTIENPIINSPFDAPARHFRFDDEGITNDVVEKRRRSAYFVPIARPKKKGAQKTFETEWTGDRLQENAQINRIRDRVDAWRSGGYVGVTAVTRRLLEYWADPQREKKLFFCQREAVETAVYIAEVAPAKAQGQRGEGAHGADALGVRGQQPRRLRPVGVRGGDGPLGREEEIDEATWSTLYSTRSRPFAPPEHGRIAVKVINHYGGEVLKVFEV